MDAYTLHSIMFEESLPYLVMWATEIRDSYLLQFLTSDPSVMDVNRERTGNSLVKARCKSDSIAQDEEDAEEDVCSDLKE